jgi:membrane protease YdiL (CAAX protease family)
MAPPAPPAQLPLDRASVVRYAVGVAIVVLAISSQYFVPQSFPASRPVYGSLVGDLGIVYGLPVVAFSLLVGPGPLRRWRADPRRAPWVGLGWYGVMGLLALLVTIALAIVYEAFDPSALELLQRPNPALQAAAGDPWFFVGFSFVVGAFEETIFRGWIFGFWASRTASWLTPAVLSSALFAAVHVYYGTTYGVAAPLIFPTLFLIGFAFAATYRSTGGNLVVPAVLHGANDAAAYLTLISLAVGTAVHWVLLLTGAIVGLVLYVRHSEATARAGPTPPGS